MRSARPPIRLAVVLLCAALLAGSAAGCSTTQEKAARAQARAKHILEARAKRHKSAHRHEHGSEKR